MCVAHLAILVRLQDAHRLKGDPTFGVGSRLSAPRMLWVSLRWPSSYETQLHVHEYVT